MDTHISLPFVTKSNKNLWLKKPYQNVSFTNFLIRKHPYILIYVIRLPRPLEGPLTISYAGYQQP